jgi:hypothetical protein
VSATAGVSNEETGWRVGVRPNTVRAWRVSFAERGAAGVGMVARGQAVPAGGHRRRGRLGDAERDPSDTSTPWTARTVATRFGIGQDTVARTRRDHERKPSKVDRSKLSNDPRFEEKPVDVVGLYLEPPVRHEAPTVSVASLQSSLVAMRSPRSSVRWCCSGRWCGRGWGACSAPAVGLAAR